MGELLYIIIVKKLPYTSDKVNISWLSLMFYLRNSQQNFHHFIFDLLEFLLTLFINLWLHLILPFY